MHGSSLQGEKAMNSDQQTLSRKMMRSFFQFRKNAWHEFSIPGLKPSEMRLLFCIKRGSRESDDIKVSEISKLLNVTSPTVTQLVNGLEEKGLVERHFDKSDRRVVNIRLTAQGEHVTQKASDVFLGLTDELIQYLGEQQSVKLVELLEKVNHYFNEKRSEVQSNMSEWS
jgi:DNA-binding MarR family transcriptional regulator